MDCVALIWHYASRARFALVPTRASLVRASPTRASPVRESAGRRFGVDADPDPVPVPFRLGRVYEIVG